MGSTGGSLGLYAGYDYQLSDMFVLGIAGDVNWDNVSIDYDGYSPYAKLNWDASIKAKLGVAVDDATLLYGTIGYGWGSFDWSNDYYDNTDGSQSFTGGGIQVGAGVQHAFTSNLVGKLEATWTSYGTHNISYEDDPYWQVK